MKDDLHEPCRRALQEVQAKAADSFRVKQVIQKNSFGHYQVLPVLQVDFFPDGFRILVGGTAESALTEPKEWR